nr:hypothetical protein [Tanacetum cinerariifolium]
MAQHSCSYCGGPFNGGNYPSCSIVGAGNKFVHDPNPFPYNNTPDFYDQPSQHHYSIDHQPYSIQEDLNQQRMNDVHNDMIESKNELLKTKQSLCEVILQREQTTYLSNHTPEPSRRFNSFSYDDEDDDDDEENENLRTILEKESDEFIKSSVEDLVPIPRSPRIRLIVTKSLALLVTPFFDANEVEYFNPGDDTDEIDAFLDIDVSTNIEDDHDQTSLKDEPDNDDLKSMVNVFDPGILDKIVSPTYVRLPFEDRHYFSLTFVIRIFLPYFTYSMDSSLLLPSESEDTIFDPGIFIFCLYSLEPMVSH